MVAEEGKKKKVVEVDSAGRNDVCVVAAVRNEDQYRAGSAKVVARDVVRYEERARRPDVAQQEE